MTRQLILDTGARVKVPDGDIDDFTEVEVTFDGDTQVIDLGTLVAQTNGDVLYLLAGEEAPEEPLPDEDEEEAVVDASPRSNTTPRSVSATIVTTQEVEEPEDDVATRVCGEPTLDGTTCRRRVARDQLGHCGVNHPGPENGPGGVRLTQPRYVPRPGQADWLVDEAFHQRGKHDQSTHGRGGGFLAPEAEWKAVQRQAEAKIANAPVPSAAQVTKARAELQKAKEGKIRAGGYAGGNSKDRKRQRENLFKEFGGEKKGYVPCHGCGTKLHHSKDNPDGYQQLERGKIFVKQQGGGYQLPNLLPECFGCNRSRNDTLLRFENT